MAGATGIRPSRLNYVPKIVDLDMNTETMIK